MVLKLRYKQMAENLKKIPREVFVGHIFLCRHPANFSYWPSFDSPGCTYHNPWFVAERVAFEV
jgi:hypothetical protein